jgi:hypothetical protein
LFLDVNLAPIDPRQQLFLLGREVADAPLADAAIVYVDVSAGMVGPGMTARPHFGGVDGSLARLCGQFAIVVAAGLPGRDRFVKFNLMASTHCQPTSASRIRRSLGGAFPCRTPWQKSAFARLNPNRRCRRCATGFGGLYYSPLNLDEGTSCQR